ncbi:U-box domain-containing protein 13-like [Rosa rugosa]|uniref:U-box domain-containing protein 13-like n=1 Tax=Rosa rugosa TaxID=74645 RepID=UPI002B411F7D|nr:U-box domain-containing protein 13-like [Rosa rugosa]XP_062024946.1 U-box domain-containing protein 13-like [Rosa rugosa]
MAKCHRNDVGSIVLDRPSTTAHSRLWSSFSAASFRRLIFDAVSCGASSRYRHRHETDAAAPPAPAPASPPAGSTLKQSEEPEKAKPKPKSEKLSDLLNLAAEWSEAESDAVTKKKVESLEELKRVAGELQVENDAVEKRREAASHVRLLAKEDSEARATLAMLGVIPPLVGMLDDSDDVDDQIASLYALLNLGIGNDVNKAAILQAGAVHKMLKLIESPNSSVSEAIIANFLGLSALDSNKPIIGSSGAIPFLLKILKNLDNTISSQAKQDALRALYNLSIFPSNVSYILETDMIPFFFNALGDMEMSERILAILSNMVSTPEGRKAISSVRDAFPVLVDALNWNDSPGCQEKASYILMVMAHKAFGDRQAMIEAGVGSALLELTLLGSTLAQKRASRILECLRVDKGKQISQNFGGSGAVSAPICGSSSSSTNPNLGSKECLEEDEDMMSDERKAVKQLVQQSLQSNMRRIVKRANLPQDFVPSDHFKSLISSSTSKSLPF